MTRPRRELISLADTPYYLITSRCVRRAFLCGYDRDSNRHYEHRRQWVEDRIRLLSSLFAIDICAYAVMSNHYHIVLKACPQQLNALDDHAIIDRWCSLFRGPLLIQQYRKGIPLSAAEQSTLRSIVSLWRDKLASISWFMRCLNQPIARQANLEDGCTGKFWEARFHSQALKTEQALLAAMAYVDLNPVRSGIARTPENSDHTSFKARIKPTFDPEAAIKQQQHSGDLRDFNTAIKPLLGFQSPHCNDQSDHLPYQYLDYLACVDWTGRLIRDNKRGYIHPQCPPILQRLGIQVDDWQRCCTRFETIHDRRFNRTATSLPFAVADTG